MGHRRPSQVSVSPVFLNLSGTTQARSVLEAMVAHSDNTATDVALGKVGVGNVRALILNAGLNQTSIPESTRRLFSYIAGAAPGSDLGGRARRNCRQAGCPVRHGLSSTLSNRC